MTQTDVLSILKANLSMTSAQTAQDTYLGQLLQAGFKAIREEGAVLDATVDQTSGEFTEIADIQDANLVVMYAAWLFRKRAEDNPSMPRMLRYSLNNKIFSQKARTE